MEISLGFLVVLLLILFPGLLFRKLYFYGEFSKQFNSGHNLVSLIAVSAIPGLIIFLGVFIFYDYFITNIDLGEIIDKLKELNDPQYKMQASGDVPIKDIIKNECTPFVAFIYMTSMLFGLFLGRFIRISRLDTKFKLLRFKNYWFYLFKGQHTNFKQMKHLKKKNKKYLFTKADILIDSNNKTHLYSGIIVDYELQDKDCSSLSKVMLQNAKRYSPKDGVRCPTEIPGSLFVVDCSSLKNINLTYIYEEAKDLLESKVPNNVITIFGLVIILLVPFYLFQFDSINFKLYNDYFSLKWYNQIIVFLLSVQILGSFIPFVKKEDSYEYANWKSILGNIVLIITLIGLLYIFS